MSTGPGEQGRDGGLEIQTAIALLPTPTVNDSRGGRNRTAVRTKPNPSNDSGRTLCDVVWLQEWDRYGPAIERWEGVHGPAPLPTIDVKGKRRLSPEFVEWMMGLPPGHTDVGISRTQRLKILGNSVVPQQAAIAWKLLS